jgi:1-acyl-sn-glycerol-3-phosphate acyltransferase
MMISLRVARLVLHLFAGMATCAFIFPFSGHARRQVLIQRWSAKLVAICRVEIAMYDVASTSHALIVSNHVSWLDIFVINALQPCRFVAKSDIRSWPLIGWLCAKTGTIFISRGKARDVRRIYQELVGSIQQGERVAFFPEGTTADQGTVLPFHANLFEAAVDAAVPIQPYALRYVDSDGQLHDAVNFTGDITFAQSLLKIFKAGPIRAELMQLPLVETEGVHRRDLANQTRIAIGARLGYTGADND